MLGITGQHSVQVVLVIAHQLRPAAEAAIATEAASEVAPAKETAATVAEQVEVAAETPIPIEPAAPAKAPTPAKRIGDRRAIFKVPSLVRLALEASEDCVVVEAEGRDRPGLLYDLTAALADLGVTILSAHIATYGERIVDVFYVKDVAGGKVVQDGKKEAVEDGLLAAINSALSPRPKDVEERVQKRTERREAARETGQKARDARTKRLKGAAE